MKTEIQVMHGIPDADVNNTVTLLKADPRYISHTVTSEGGGTNTISGTLLVMNGLTKAEVDEAVTILKARPGYTGHNVTPEDGGNTFKISL